MNDSKQIPTQNGRIYGAIKNVPVIGPVASSLKNIPFLTNVDALRDMANIPEGIITIGETTYIFSPQLVEALISQQRADTKSALQDGEQDLDRGNTVKTLGEKVMGEYGPITVPTGKFWVKLNAILTQQVGNPLKMSELMLAINSSADNFVSDMEEMLVSGMEVDPVEFVQSSSLEMIIKRTLGIDLAEFESRLRQKTGDSNFDSSKYIRAVHKALVSHMLPTQFGLDSMVLPGGKTAVKVLEEFMSAFILIAEDLNQEAGTPNIVTILKENEIEAPEVIASILHQLIAAGHETTSNVLNVGIREVLNNPDMLNEIIGEISSWDFDSEDIHEKLKTFENSALGRFILELLRLYPATPIIPLGVVNEISIGEYTLEPGQQVQVNIFALHTRSEDWGEDANEFNPSRWKQDDEVTKKDAKSTSLRKIASYLPFWDGPRACTGERFAKGELFILLGKLIQMLAKLPSTVSVIDQGKVSSATGTTVLSGLKVQMDTTI